MIVEGVLNKCSRIIPETKIRLNKNLVKTNMKNINSFENPENELFVNSFNKALSKTPYISDNIQRLYEKKQIQKTNYSLEDDLFLMNINNFLFEKKQKILSSFTKISNKITNYFDEKHDLFINKENEDKKLEILNQKEAIEEEKEIIPNKIENEDVQQTNNEMEEIIDEINDLFEDKNKVDKICVNSEKKESEPQETKSLKDNDLVIEEKNIYNIENEENLTKIQSKYKSEENGTKTEENNTFKTENIETKNEEKRNYDDVNGKKNKEEKDNFSNEIVLEGKLDKNIKKISLANLISLYSQDLEEQQEKNNFLVSKIKENIKNEKKILDIFLVEEESYDEMLADLCFFTKEENEYLIFLENKQQSSHLSKPIASKVFFFIKNKIN